MLSSLPFSFILRLPVRTTDIEWIMVVEFVGYYQAQFLWNFQEWRSKSIHFFIDLSINKENRWQSCLIVPVFRASVICLVKQVKSFSQPYIYVEDQPTFPTAMLCFDTFLMLLNRLNQDKVWQWKHFWLDLISMDIIFW